MPATDTVGDGDPMGCGGPLGGSHGQHRCHRLPRSSDCDDPMSCSDDMTLSWGSPIPRTTRRSDHVKMWIGWVTARLGLDRARRGGTPAGAPAARGRLVPRVHRAASAPAVAAAVSAQRRGPFSRSCPAGAGRVAIAGGPTADARRHVRRAASMTPPWLSVVRAISRVAPHAPHASAAMLAYRVPLKARPGCL